MAVICLTLSCQQAKEELIIELEYASNIQWLEEQGYIPLEKTHEHYEYIISLLAEEKSDQLISRSQSCQWEGRDSFSCDSGSGGKCTVFIHPGGDGIKACLVCVGGDDHGDADCI